MTDLQKPTTLENSNNHAIPGLFSYVKDASEDNPLHVEVVIEDNGRVILFHDKVFKHGVAWFEYNLQTSRLIFIMEEGQQADFGIPLSPSVAKYMHNAQQVLLVYLNDETGDAVEGAYIPLILHES